LAGQLAHPLRLVATTVSIEPLRDAEIVASGRTPRFAASARGDGPELLVTRAGLLHLAEVAPDSTFA